MGEHRFKIEKNRVYRQYDPEQVIPFSKWLREVYMTPQGRRMFYAQENDTHIKIKITTVGLMEKEKVRAFLLTVLSDFKQYFIQGILGDLRVAYLDDTESSHKEVKDMIDSQRYDADNVEIASVYDILAEIENSFMSLEVFEGNVGAVEKVEEVIKTEKETLNDEELIDLLLMFNEIDNERDEEENNDRD